MTQETRISRLLCHVSCLEGSGISFADVFRQGDEPSWDKPKTKLVERPMKWPAM
jgi:hypothetical protein